MWLSGSAYVRVDARQERQSEWRRRAVIQGRQDVEGHVTGAAPNDLDQKWQQSAHRAEQHLPRDPECRARQDLGEQEGRERPEERADRPLRAREPEEDHENTDQRPLSDSRSDKPTARLPRARGALKDQVISRHALHLTAGRRAPAKATRDSNAKRPWILELYTAEIIA